MKLAFLSSVLLSLSFYGIASMWSFVQYKQIGSDVEREWRRRYTNQSVLIGRHRTGGFFRASQQSDATLPGDDPERHGFERSDNSPEEKQIEDGKVIVELEGDNDPIDPHNWPLLKRARTILILSMLVFTQAWAGACDSLGNQRASAQYHVSPVAEDLSTAMYLFGIGSGCLFVGPLSQTLGRNPVYLSGTLIYLCFILGTSLAKNYASQVVFRYLAGLASSAALGINGATVGDMFRPVERSLWFPVIAWVNVARKLCLIPTMFGITDDLQLLSSHLS